MPIKQSCWAIIKNDNDQILLLKRSKKVKNSGLWNVPGGTVDDGEKPKDSIIRELNEEAGLKLNNLKFTKVILKPDAQMFFFTGKLSDISKVKINEESSAIKWCSVDELKKLDLHKPTFMFFS